MVIPVACNRREWLFEAGESLDAAEDAWTAGDGEPRRLLLEIRETAPGHGKRAKGERARTRAEHRERIK